MTIASRNPSDFKGQSALKKWMISQWILEHGKRPYKLAKDPIEGMLGVALNSYTAVNSCSFDYKFRALIQRMAPRRLCDSDGKKKRVLAFIRRHGRRPSVTNAKNERERRRATWMYRFSSPMNDNYDAAFAAQVERLAPTNVRPEKRKIEIIKFLIHNQRFPSRKDGQIGQAFSNYIHKGTRGYDSRYADIIKTCFGREIRTQKEISADCKEMKAKVLAFCRKHNRRPKETIESEKALYRWMSAACRPDRVGFEEFRAHLNEKWPRPQASNTKDKIVRFIVEHKRRPTYKAKTKAERRLCGNMTRYISPKSSVFDQTFRHYLNTLAPAGKRGRPRKLKGDAISTTGAT